ncbi:hypothetical protein [Paenibacillus sp. J2TS4]|nr:hypothetical protein [Paenibacillus sp. J2TS4]GIP34214.1 hypothetical protein J2TS4_34240 [Paenibacillus sp. J2TS4]
MRIIDLSGPLESGMWNYGSPFPPIQVEQVAQLDREGYQGHSLH